MQTNVTPDSIHFDDAPGGDLDLDSIFGGNPEPKEPETPATPTPQTEPENTEFLRNASGTVVYKTADDAIKGIEHKDALISELREKLASQTGRDPLKTEKAPVSYLENAEAYFDDIAKAKDKNELVRIQAKLVNDTMAPYAPIIGSVAKSQAVAKAAEEIPEFSKFQSSSEYQETLNQYPLIKLSIDIAESNPHMANDLVQLYKMAYEIASSKTLSKLVQERQQATPAAPTPVRPTVTSTPVAPGTVRTAPPTLRTSDGRKSIIAAFEERGNADLPM